MTNPRDRRIELVIVLALLAASGFWGARFWNEWTARGGQPVFYQTYFEPAVMIACGRGFVISKHQPKPLEDFLFLRADSFDCRDLPEDLELDPDHVYQEPWLYLEATVGWTWRLLGVSWSGMGPLFGVLFGMVIALAYAICRLCTGRLLALSAAAGLTVSSMHLLNLPHLRDYAKAPFTLALVLIIAWLVTRPVRAKTLLALSAAYGVVLGIGYGFRTDFLAALPVLVIVVFGFLEGGLTRHLKLKAGAAALFLATFAVVSWPITSAVYTKGGCQWHVALLGLQAPHDQNLRVGAAPYDFGHAYSDEYMSRTVSGYAFRMQPGREPLVFCSHDYDVQSGHYLRAIVLSFPGDVLTRASASVLQIVELPFRHWAAPMDGWFPFLYRVRAVLLAPGVRWGTYVMIAALLMTIAVSLRLALFMVFFLAYFGGYPAIQFQERHFFHLEFMGWWALAFVAHHVVAAAWSLRVGLPDMKPLAWRAVRAGAFACGSAGLVAGVLGTARWYQAGQVRQLLSAYIAAPKTPVDPPERALADLGAAGWPQLLEVDVNEAACGEKASVTFQYDKASIGRDFTSTVTLDHPSRGSGPTRIFMPVFETYTGLKLANAGPGCITGAYRVTDLRPFPLLLGATLPPQWESLPLHQRLTDWEGAARQAVSGPDASGRGVPPG